MFVRYSKEPAYCFGSTEFKTKGVSDKTYSDLCDKQKAEEEANRTETKKQQLSPITLPEDGGEHVGHRSHQAFQRDKLEARRPVIKRS